MPASVLNFQQAATSTSLPEINAGNYIVAIVSAAQTQYIVTAIGTGGIEGKWSLLGAITDGAVGDLEFWAFTEYESVAAPVVFTPFFSGNLTAAPGISVMEVLFAGPDPLIAVTFKSTESLSVSTIPQIPALTLGAANELVVGAAMRVSGSLPSISAANGYTYLGSPFFVGYQEFLNTTTFTSPTFSGVSGAAWMSGSMAFYSADVVPQSRARSKSKMLPFSLSSNLSQLSRAVTSKSKVPQFSLLAGQGVGVLRTPGEVTSQSRVLRPTVTFGATVHARVARSSGVVYRVAPKWGINATTRAAKSQSKMGNVGGSKPSGQKPPIPRSTGRQVRTFSITHGSNLTPKPSRSGSKILVGFKIKTGTAVPANPVVRISKSTSKVGYSLKAGHGVNIVASVPATGLVRSPAPAVFAGRGAFIHATPAKSSSKCAVPLVSHGVVIHWW